MYLKGLGVTPYYLNYKGGNMGIRIGINGFGRIGRYLFRVVHDRRPDLEIVAVNARAGVDTLAHLLKYDSVHGRFPGEVKVKGNKMVVDEREVTIANITGNLTKLPWKELGVDIVFETTGKFRDKERNIGHLRAGAKKVIIGAPGKGVDNTIVMGVNEKTYDPERHHIISNASCTTNCFAPIVKVIHENFIIKKGLMTTVHGYTMGQRILDGSHKDLRRARAAALSIVPTTTGAATDTTKVIPELEGKLAATAIRVPTPDVAITDFVAEVERKTNVDKVNSAFKKASEADLKGILGYNEEPLVSTDYIGSPYSAIVDGPLTKVMDENLVKVFAWYDNEAGFAYRMIDLALYIGRYL